MSVSTLALVQVTASFLSQDEFIFTPAPAIRGALVEFDQKILVSFQNSLKLESCEVSCFIKQIVDDRNVTLRCDIDIVQ